MVNHIEPRCGSTYSSIKKLKTPKGLNPINHVCNAWDWVITRGGEGRR